MNLEQLVTSIEQIDLDLRRQSMRAVSCSLTVRNWLIGWHIAEYELKGEDRAVYGDGLLRALSERLSSQGLSGCDRRLLYRYRKLYRVYPHIVQSLSGHLVDSEFTNQVPSTEIVQTVSGQFIPDHIKSLTFSHLDLFVDIEDPLKRSFYEIECIKGNWSVRQLKRQITSLLFERTGLSRKPEVLTELTRQGSEANQPELIIRDPYIFEFLGFKPSDAMYESDLEQMLLEKLQAFLLELGRGFCLEAGDNPPVGLLLCTEKNHALVEYALAGMDSRLFVSKYQLELPDPERIRQYIEEQRKELEGSGPRSRSTRRAD